ncbi:carbohydrate ABC transporter permease [Parasedimentitalea maritima]|uniref:Maltose/maltodextrin transport system permease protein MalG n=1 Tax=Parasedimentitalea maritima TaxID=2578117 RepID=A0A6A4RBR3_9RHOB|nr:carbohydrate ABC transporter permease [Zongyanglinia marina]KAE9630810.1 ABC transporter permease subunit [Zongyanglinia marina]
MHRSLIASFALYSAALLLTLFTLAPLVWLVLMSISSPNDLTSVPLNWWPTEVDLSRYGHLVDLNNGAGQRFLAALRNSLLTAGGATLIALIVAVPAAYAFSRRGASLALLFVFLATIMMPPITYVLPLYEIFGGLGALNKTTTLIIVYSAMLLPFATWLMKSNIDVLPVEIEQAAFMEGASTAFTLRRVVLPLALPAIAATCMLSFLVAWDEFFYALIFTSDLSAKTLPVAIADFSAGRVTDYGVIASVGVLATLPPAILAICFQRFIVSGLAAGSVKG